MPGFRTSSIHDRPGWPDLTWHTEALAVALSEVHLARRELLQQLPPPGSADRNAITLETLVQDVTASSRIEGEHLDVGQVRCAVARRLGLPDDGLPEPARHVERIVGMTLDAAQHPDRPLTAERLCRWHHLLFPDGQDGHGHLMQVGRWRDTEMQVVSPNLSKPVVLFEAPTPDRVPGEMEVFLAWVEADRPVDPVLKAGLAHLHFLTVHPFEDGNGRIARALTGLLLARADRLTSSAFSLSRQLEVRRSEYYRVLERVQRGESADVTDWLAFYLTALTAALDEARTALTLARRGVCTSRTSPTSASRNACGGCLTGCSCRSRGS